MNAAQLWEVELKGDAPVLVHGPGASQWAHAQTQRENATVLDLRQMDTPRPTLPLRIEMMARWDRERVLYVQIDESPTDDVLALLFEATRRAFNVTPAHVGRAPKTGKLTVVVDTATPPLKLLRLFAHRIPAAKLGAVTAGPQAAALAAKGAPRGH